MSHRMLIIIITILFLAVAIVTAFLFFSRKSERWVVYYTETLPAQSFAKFDLIVFDRDSHPPLHSLIDGKKTILGYISLGEAETYRKNFEELKALGLILDTDSAWKGNPIIDTRNPQWHSYVLDNIIPSILAQGFDGIMIDTVDSIIWLENHNPASYYGLKNAMVELIKNIRARYPGMTIMLNRGFEILPNVSDDIDMFLAESTLTTLNHENGEWFFLNDSERRDYLTKLYAAKNKSPRLKIYTRDYWPPTDIQTIGKIYATQRAAGFIPYVSTIDLQTLTPEPEGKY